MASTQYMACKVCKAIKSFEDLFSCARCKKICCMEHAEEGLAFCPDCYRDVMEELEVEEGEVEAKIRALKNGATGI